jgi:hypothetical protein
MRRTVCAGHGANLPVPADLQQRREPPVSLLQAGLQPGLLELMLRIRIRRNRMFLGHPDRLGRGTDPDPDPWFLLFCDFFMSFVFKK